MLTPQVLPAGFAPIAGETGYESARAVAKETGVAVALVEKWGYANGYDAVFRSGSGIGPFGVWSNVQEIVSDVAVYHSSSGAAAEYARVRAGCSRSPSRELSLGGAKVGNTAVLCEEPVKLFGNAPPGLGALVYRTSWLRGNLLGGVEALGIEGQVVPARAIELAKAQDELMSGKKPAPISVGSAAETTISRRAAQVAEAFSSVGIALQTNNATVSVNGKTVPSSPEIDMNASDLSLSYSLDVYIEPTASAFTASRWTAKVKYWDHWRLPHVQIRNAVVLVTPYTYSADPAMPKAVARAIALLRRS